MGNATDIFTSVPIDIFGIGAIVLLLGIDAIRNGVGRTAAFSVALPLALFMHSLLSSAFLVGSLSFFTSSPMAVALTLLGFIAVSYHFARRVGLEYVDGGRGLVQGIFAAVAATALLIVVWLQVPAFDALWHLSDPIRALFAEQYRLWWLLGSYVILVFSRG